MGRGAVMCAMLVVLGCGDDGASPSGSRSESESRSETRSESETESESESESRSESGPLPFVALVDERALERRSTASPTEGEPWAAERVPVEAGVVLVGAAADHVLLLEPVVDRLGLGSRFHVVPRGGAAAEPVEAVRAHVAPDGEHWVVERPHESFRCGGVKRGRDAFARAFAGEGERPLGEEFLGFGTDGRALLHTTTADCAPAGGLRNQRSFLRLASVTESEPSTEPGAIGGLGEGSDDRSARLGYHPPPWIDAPPAAVEVEAGVFGYLCFLDLADGRTPVVGPGCTQPESAAFSADGARYALVAHEDGQAVLWVIERANGALRRVPLGPAPDPGEKPEICGGPTGERWLVSRGATLLSVAGDEVTELGTGHCIGAAPGGATWAVQTGGHIELRDARQPSEPGTVLEGVTDLAWLPAET